VGSPSFSGVQERLRRIGCQAHWARPLPGQDDAARNHRKMIIVDGRVGIAGGFGIDDKWDGDGLHDEPPQWRDSNLRVSGPAVLQMQQAFAENWQEHTGALLPPEAFPPAEEAGGAQAGFLASTESSVATRADRVTQLLIAAAHKRLWISNAYFVPSTPILELLSRKAREGMDVRILAAGDKTDAKVYLSEQRARMDRLAEDGARVYEYEPTMMHGKTMLVDDSLVSVGSCNMDALSLNKMEEGALLVDDAQLAAEEEKLFLEDLAHSVERVPRARRTAGR
jgi:cardiolipin synthase